MTPRPQQPTHNAQGAGAQHRRGAWWLVKRTLSKAWEGSLFSEAAEAAFWQVLSLPPLLLGLLGSLGYVAEWFRPDLITEVQDKITEWSRTAFSANVVNGIIAPTISDILRNGRGEILTVGFLISLWAGSSAMSSFVDAITVAHDQYGVRHEVWQRIFALLLYMASLVLLVVGLPVLALGPDLLPDLFPAAWRPEIKDWVGLLYYPALGVLLVLALATLYKVALPRKLPWHRLLPGAILAMVVFLLSSIGLRLYIAWITTTGYTYGALATPIAFLLFAYFIGMAIVIGAYFNAAIQEMYPAKPSRRQRRRWRRLELEHVAEQIRQDGERATPVNAASAGDPVTAADTADPAADDTPAAGANPANPANPAEADGVAQPDGTAETNGTSVRPSTQVRRQ
ncbi:MAG: YihY/virulence factor BrkB family protein [Labedaea sp.]